MHERGTFVGIATVALINGPHLASLREFLLTLDWAVLMLMSDAFPAGGFLAQYVGWRWTLWLPSICAGVVWV